MQVVKGILRQPHVDSFSRLCSCKNVANEAFGEFWVGLGAVLFFHQQQIHAQCCKDQERLLCRDQG